MFSARSTLCLMVFVCASTLALRAQNSANVDPAKRADQIAPSGDNIDTSLSTGREGNQRPFFGNEHLQEQRYGSREVVERKDFVAQDKRAPINTAEARDKTIVDRKEYPNKPEVMDNQPSHLDGQRSRIQPKDEALKRYGTVAKYQDRIGDAKTAAAQRAPTVEKRTTFEKLNRFVFKRNSPGSESGNPTVTPAAGGPAPASQDTHIKYQVEWKRFEPTQPGKPVQ